MYTSRLEIMWRGTIVLVGRIVEVFLARGKLRMPRRLLLDETATTSSRFKKDASLALHRADFSVSSYSARSEPTA